MTKTVSGRRIDESQWKLACEDTILARMRDVLNSPLCPDNERWLDFASLMTMMGGWKEADVRLVLHDLVDDGVLKSNDQDQYAFADPPTGRDKTSALERRVHRLEGIVADLEMRPSRAEATD